MDPAGFRYRPPGAYSDRTAVSAWTGRFDVEVDDGSGYETALEQDGFPWRELVLASPPEGELRCMGICGRCRERMTCLEPSAIAARVLGFPGGTGRSGGRRQGYGRRPH